jgi:hypothetical protein
MLHHFVYREIKFQCSDVAFIAIIFILEFSYLNKSSSRFVIVKLVNFNYEISFLWMSLVDIVIEIVVLESCSLM